MDNVSCSKMLFALTALLLAAPTTAVTNSSICETNTFCVCTSGDHPNFGNVKCELDQTDLNVQWGSFLDDVTDIEIIAGSSVVFSEFSLKNLINLRTLTIRSCKSVKFSTNSITELESPNLRIYVAKTIDVKFNANAFHVAKNTVETVEEALRADRVKPEPGISLKLEGITSAEIQSGAFSNAVEIFIYVVESLTLFEEAFKMEKTRIEISETRMYNIPKNTFSISAARVLLNHVKVKYMEDGAFSATSIDELTFIKCDIEEVKAEAFNEGTILNEFNIEGTKIGELKSRAIAAGVTSFRIKDTRIKKINSGGIDVSAASLELEGNHFVECASESIKVNQFNELIIESNIIEKSDPNTFSLNPVQNQKATLTLSKNNISSIPIFHETSTKLNVEGNIFGLCFCNMSNSNMSKELLDNNFCLGYDLICTSKDINSAVQSKEVISNFLPTCKNPKIMKPQCSNELPTDDNEASENTLGKYSIITRNVMVTVALIVFVIVIIIVKFKIPIALPHCSSFDNVCRWIFLLNVCFRRPNEIQAAGSIALNQTQQDSIEMQCMDEFINNYSDNEYTEVLTCDKGTQSLPEQLNKEFLENLKERLCNPECCEEAKAVVGHLYEVMKVEEYCNGIVKGDEENLYDLPIPPPEKKKFKKNKRCFSVGTDVPSLEKLFPFSACNGKTTLCHEYFEPKDLAVHVYSEIDNYTRAAVKNALAGQALPRGPFLQAIQEKKRNDPTLTMTSNGSGASVMSAKMLNRPLPAQPSATPSSIDPGEGTSY